MFEAKINMNCNEAIAWGAMASGVDLVAHYPGSPVNLVELNVKKLNDRFHGNVQFNNFL